MRTWDASAHPLWLVFEVEGRLQIRPAQHTMAQILLERSSSGGRGPIGQLNMGEGKTRVILPMMILALADGHNLVSGWCRRSLCCRSLVAAACSSWEWQVATGCCPAAHICIMLVLPS